MNNEINSPEIYTIDSDPNRDVEKNSLPNLHQVVLENWPNIPFKELHKRSVIDDESVASVTAFLSTTTNNKNLFRKAPTSNDFQSEIWLSIVQKEAFELEKTINFPDFFPDLITDNLIAHLRNLTNKPECLLEVNTVMQSIGIVLIYEKTLNSSLVDGAVGKTISGRPYIGMSLRHNRLDNYWFTLFHEFLYSILKTSPVSLILKLKQIYSLRII
jgi:HTH-type transcriptional regulator/antitoxin HigA